MQISSSDTFLIDSYQKSNALNDSSELISYTRIAPSAFLICEIVIALYLSAPDVSHNWMLKDIFGSSWSTSLASKNPNSTPIVASYSWNSWSNNRLIILVLPTLISPKITTFFNKFTYFLSYTFFCFPNFLKMHLYLYNFFLFPLFCKNCL